MFYRLWLALVGLFVAASAQALDFQVSPAVAAVFSQAKVNGTFVLYDVSRQRLFGLDQKRAETRFSPASTFKIPNSLIGLSVGAVRNVDEILFHYDGKTPLYLKSWQKDVGLREAFAVSHLLAYQELARRIGLDRMQTNVAKLNYGNAQIGQTVDTFWLDDVLKISAVEQTAFLARLAHSQLPFPVNAQMQVRDIAKLEQGDDWVLYGKTGWTGKAQPSVGWFVGWIEQKGNIYSFALNMDIPDETFLPKRKEVAKASLRALGLL